MRFYSAEDLRSVVDLEYLVDALEAGHRTPKPEVATSLIGPPQSRYLVRSAHDGRSLAGTKLISIVPDNPESRGTPAVQAVIVLFDAESGVPSAMLEATDLTYWKTAADSALASRFLSRADSATLAIAGAGGLAPWLLRGHITVRPAIERVLVWNRTSEKAAALVDSLCVDGIEAEMAEDLEDAVAQADIVSTATMASEPILKGAWLKPGTHVDLVGSYSEDTRESDDDAITSGRLFVDYRDSALEGVGDVLKPIADGLISEADIVGDLFDLVGGAVSGRTGPDEITVFKNAGGAHLDIMVAAALVDRLQGHRQ
jgi:ornithine cyclodeaminase